MCGDDHLFPNSQKGIQNACRVNGQSQIRRCINVSNKFEIQVLENRNWFQIRIKVNSVVYINYLKGNLPASLLF